ncbi:hypothetical protein IQ260_09875 [Leptolyngbya cf. ectocarpi LEGE 11479]|uniref:Uncharacterized protein n=1 Tax=Leptolyngbya cf. ectocarpi LEGE 11479 TaxID=1828722 RepID=A0A928X4E7_LEPEC|nr:hypothetical protein [Leptolyngbya ectocarpi]MBE9066963.1 hypothetical protein [Leptolyngbya cf. ectocarpi LEGE 11479]
MPQQPMRSQPLAWLCGMALAALVLVPQEQLTRFSGGLMGQRHATHQGELRTGGLHRL